MRDECSPPGAGPELRIEPGRDKHGQPETCGALVVRAGETVAVVGMTGSGKTRLLADIERLSPGDSPTGRRVTLAAGPAERAVSTLGVARITQSMQFFLDLNVGEFVAMHVDALGRSGRVDPSDVIAAANTLAGEAFAAGDPLAHLSGGQARALMIADAALVANAPVLLIDEIENAGIDRRAALRFLSRPGRIVVLATHDPGIALGATRRWVMADGAIRTVRETTLGERRRAAALARTESRLSILRADLREGREVGTRGPV